LSFIEPGGFSLKIASAVEISVNSKSWNMYKAWHLIDML